MCINDILIFYDFSFLCKLLLEEMEFYFRALKK